jgi:hypothetical protein
VASPCEVLISIFFFFSLFFFTLWVNLLLSASVSNDDCPYYFSHDLAQLCALHVSPWWSLGAWLIKCMVEKETTLCFYFSNLGDLSG